jgi:hypothetical protein
MCGVVSGVFFVASLLDIHSGYLTTANATEITQWFDDISTNAADWYRKCGRSSANSWPAFTRGWIHGTAGR